MKLKVGTGVWDSHQGDVNLKRAPGTDSHSIHKEGMKMGLRDRYSHPLPCVFNTRLMDADPQKLDRVLAALRHAHRLNAILREQESE